LITFDVFPIFVVGKKWQQACSLRLKREAKMNPSFLLGTELLTIGQKTLAKAHRRFLSCERCDAQATTPFELILEDVVGPTENYVEYLMSEPGSCPKCHEAVFESTLIRPDEEFARNQCTDKVYAPSLENTTFVFVVEGTLKAAQSYILGCEQCTPDAEISLDYILDQLTGCDPTSTEYILCRPTSCPQCFGQVTEKTLVIAP